MGLFVILMGAQGAGKGVQAQFIQQTYGIPHVSTGDIFRAMRTRSDALAQEVQDVMNRGQLINDELTNRVVADRLSLPDAAGGVILDGYPRNAVQAQFLEDFLAQRGEQLKAVILLDIDLYTAFKRAFGRVTSASGESHNIYFRNEGLTVDVAKDPSNTYPPRITATVTATGEALVRRPDDADAYAIIQRIDTYLASTQPLIDYYAGKASVLHRLNADQSIETVSAHIQRILG